MSLDTIKLDTALKIFPSIILEYVGEMDVAEMVALSCTAADDIIEKCQIPVPFVPLAWGKDKKTEVQDSTNIDMELDNASNNG